MSILHYIARCHYHIIGCKDCRSNILFIKYLHYMNVYNHVRLWCWNIKHMKPAMHFRPLCQEAPARFPPWGSSHHEQWRRRHRETPEVKVIVQYTSSHILWSYMLQYCCITVLSVQGPTSSNDLSNCPCCWPSGKPRSDKAPPRGPNSNKHVVSFRHKKMKNIYKTYKTKYLVIWWNCVINIILVNEIVYQFFWIRPWH